jgi:3',5'-cyclic AMP phosphodiesterase CpdA
MTKTREMDRRDFLKAAGIGGGVVFVSGLGIVPGLGRTARGAESQSDFYFVQLSDTHWGFEGPKINPEATVTLKKTVAVVNGLKLQPDFIVFTGDLTHTTDDPQVRRKRRSEFRSIVKDLKVKDVKFMPGEHDASLDHGEAFKELFGPTYYKFTHKGVSFIALDNVSDPGGAVGATQVAWLKESLKGIGRDEPLIVLAHRPLFDLAPEWDWATQDGKEVIDALMPHNNVTVFYGHIHQENHFRTGHIAHHSAKSLMFPLPAPRSVPKKAPIPWDAAHPFKGLGFRSIEEEKGKVGEVQEWPLASG